LEEGLKGFVKRCLLERGAPGPGLVLEPMAGDGSVRSFFRVRGANGISLGVAMENAPVDDAAKRENRAYKMIGVHLRKKGVPVPEIYGDDPERGWFLMQDLGPCSMQDVLKAGHDPFPVFEAVFDVLIRMQVEGAKGFDTQWCCQSERYDREIMRRKESDYFRDAFLTGYLGLDRDFSSLEKGFDWLADRASGAGAELFMHRDFQSRNIIIKDGRIGIVDWQGGRMGPAGYDLASLLMDPYAGIDSKTMQRLYVSYRLRLDRECPRLAEELDAYFPFLAIQRNLQILGAFGFLSRVRKKAYFEAYIPGALESLHRLLTERREPAFKELADLVEEIYEGSQPMERKRAFDPEDMVSASNGQIGMVVAPADLETLRARFKEGRRAGSHFAPGCCHVLDYTTQVPVLFEDGTYNVMRGISIRKAKTGHEEKKTKIKGLLKG